MSNEMRVEVSSCCNFKCSICPYPTMNRPRQNMPLKWFVGFVNRILEGPRKYDSITFSGIGEPFLNPEIEFMILFAKQKGLKTTVVTNGSLLDMKTYDMLEELKALDFLRISLPGADQEDYSRITGRSERQYYELTERIDTILARPERTIKLGIYIAVNKCAYPEPIVKRWEKADILEIWKVHNWADRFDNRRVSDFESLTTCGRICNGPLQVLVDGRVAACCFDYEGRLIYGDLKTEGIEAIFESTEYFRIKRAHKSGTGHDYICQVCDQREADKSGYLLYSSFEGNSADRTNRTSTTFERIIK